MASADQQLYQFVKIGRFMVASFFLENTSTGSGMGNRLTITLPLGMAASNTTYTGPLTIRGDIETEGYITTGGTTSLYCFRTDHAAWPSSVTNDLDIRGMITLQVTQ